jgi:hypothetical protein
VAGVEGEHVARLWFVGANPWLGEVSPIEAIRDMRQGGHGRGCRYDRGQVLRLTQVCSAKGLGLCGRAGPRVKNREIHGKLKMPGRLLFS